jgi:hypothetical protein
MDPEDGCAILGRSIGDAENRGLAVGDKVRSARPMGDDEEDAGLSGRILRIPASPVGKHSSVWV